MVNHYILIVVYLLLVALQVLVGVAWVSTDGYYNKWHRPLVLIQCALLLVLVMAALV
jgi:hypothetical protein